MTVVLRLPRETVEQIDLMAGEVGMSRNSLCRLLLDQGAAFHRAASEQPGLFSPTEQLITEAIRRGMGK